MSDDIERIAEREAIVTQDDVDAYWKHEDFCAPPPRVEKPDFKPCVGMVIFARHRAASEARLIARLGEPDMVEIAAWALAVKLAHPHGDKPDRWMKSARREEAYAMLAAVSDALKGE